MKYILTEAGQYLIDKCQKRHSGLTLTRVMLGDGMREITDEPFTWITLSSPVISCPVVERGFKEDIPFARIKFKHTEIPREFFLREFGVYARATEPNSPWDMGETLLVYGAWKGTLEGMLDEEPMRIVAIDNGINRGLGWEYAFSVPLTYSPGMKTLR